MPLKGYLQSLSLIQFVLLIACLTDLNKWHKMQIRDFESKDGKDMYLFIKIKYK